MVSSSSFSLEVRKEGLLLRKNSRGVSRPLWRLSKNSPENKLKYATLGTHTTGRTPAGLNQRSRLFPKEPIGAQSRGWLPSAPCGREERGPPGRIRRCNSQHAVPRRHTLAFTQAMFCLFLLFLSAIHANRRVGFLVLEFCEKQVGYTACHTLCCKTVGQWRCPFNCGR